MFKKAWIFLSLGMIFVVPLSLAQTPGSESAPVSLEINVVQIVLNDEHRQGVDWEAIVSDFHALQLKRLDHTAEVDKKYRISVGNVSSEDYTVLLDALDTVGRMTKQEQPGVSINSGVKTGIDINIADGKRFNHVHLDVSMRAVSQEDIKLTIEPGIEYPIKENGQMGIAIFQAGTDVVLKEDNAIVLGGIITEQEVTKTHKFPLLGDLPIVGLVFRSQGRLMQKIETVIFITPHMKTVVGENAKE